MKDTAELITPCLIYDLEKIHGNIRKAINVAGSPERLWPHVKSHKCIEMVKLQIGYYITKFKAATIAEAEMAAMAGAGQVILAYPLVEPNIKRFVDLVKAYPNTVFYGIGDDFDSLEALSEECIWQQIKLPVLLDINMGMNRTGVEPDRAEALYRLVNRLTGIQMSGLHCYDGHHNDREFAVRNERVRQVDQEIASMIGRLTKDGICCEIVVAGGTPSFPCHAGNTTWYLSPGTAFLTDAGYYNNLPDLSFKPAAAVLTRVVSHPARGMFTLDLGYKGIAADPAGVRGYIVGLEDAQQVLHSEEHWVFKLEDESRIPAIGSSHYVVPTHICPTSALYPEILVAEYGEIVETWQVTARNRKINY